jgi:hypothetical protein
VTDLRKFFCVGEEGGPLDEGGHTVQCCTIFIGASNSRTFEPTSRLGSYCDPQSNELIPPPEICAMLSNSWKLKHAEDLSDSWKCKSPGTNTEGRAWTDEDRLEVYFDGCKHFWRTRTNVDIIVVEHKDHQIIEIVTYTPVVDREATRLYLSDDVVYSKLDHSEFEEALRLAKEPLLRRRIVPDREKLMKAIVKEAKTNYIMNRLCIEECCLETRTFKVGFQFNFRDFAGDTDPANLMLVERPKHLKRLVSPHYKSLM